MGWLDSLQGSVVGFDTMPLIYYIEEHPNYLNVVDPFFEAIERSEFKVVTSIVTLLEVLVHPIRNGDAILAQKYRDLLFDTEGLSTMELDQEIAEEAARLRELTKFARQIPFKWLQLSLWERLSFLRMILAYHPCQI